MVNLEEKMDRILNIVIETRKNIKNIKNAVDKLIDRLERYYV